MYASKSGKSGADVGLQLEAFRGIQIKMKHFVVNFGANALGNENSETDAFGLHFYFITFPNNLITALIIPLNKFQLGQLGPVNPIQTLTVDSGE